MKKHLIFLFISIVYNIGLTAQPDTIIAENIYRYKIKDGKRTKEKQLIEQNTYDLQGKLIRNIVFKDSLGIKAYTAFIYNNDRLISGETFDGKDDSVMEVIRYSYTPDGLVSEKKIYRKDKNELIKPEKTIRYGYRDTMLVKKEVRNAKNKWQVKTDLTRSENEGSVITRYRKGYRDDRLKQRIKKMRFNDDGKISRATINDTYYTGETTEITIDYEYNPYVNKVSREILRTGTDSVPTIKEYRYNTGDGTLTGECYVDEDNNYIEFTGYERKKHDVIRKEVMMYDLQKEMKK
ncbi:MAG: hypothetical protein PVF73_03275 [Bacteroidales bacterium]|jgi:hypothetical protein